MQLIPLSVILLCLRIVEPYCNLFSDSDALTCKYGLQESQSGIGAGFVRNLTAHCVYEKGRDIYHYEFSWQHPKSTGTPISKYRIKILYDISKQVCFLAPPSQSKFIFNESIGFLYGCGFDLYVTPLPIVYVNDFFQAESIQVYGCPVAPVLLPLPNIIAQPGSSYSFVTKFAEEPIPRPFINWYFTPDKVYCKNLTLIGNGSADMLVSTDRRILKIFNITKVHVGCYVATANNSVGRVDEQRGYLDLNISLPVTLLASMRSVYNAIEGPLFGSLAGILIALLIIFLLVLLHRRKRHFSSGEDCLLGKKIYISHCAMGDQESASLCQFSSNLKSFGVDVILDIFSQVEINNSGGISHWVQRNMAKADKIIIFVTSNYVSAMKSAYKDSFDDAGKSVRKLHWEFDCMNNLVHSSLEKQNENIMIVSETDFKKDDLPYNLNRCKIFKISRLNQSGFKVLRNVLLS